MPDYSELVSKARAWSGRGEIVGLAHELADAVEKLVAENADLREDEQEALEERNAALKQRNALQTQIDALTVVPANMFSYEQTAGGWQVCNQCGCRVTQERTHVRFHAMIAAALGG